MFANKNNLRSELTANIGVLATTISITAGEGILWENDMVACLEHYENDVCTKREIIKITAKNNDTFTVTRGFAVCIMNDETKQQGQEIQTFSVGDFLSLYLSKELRESITQNIGINETALQTMVGHLNSPRTYINDNCLSWKQSIDSAYNTKYGGLAGFGDASDGDLVITEDTFLDASREYNFNNLTICENATLRFCGLGVPTINVRNNFKNYGTIDMRAPYLQARNTELTDHRLFTNDKVSNNTDDLTQLGTEGGFYKGGSGAGGTASGSDASDGHGGNGGSGGAYDGINGGNGGTSGSFGTGGGGGFGMGKGGNGGTGACGGGNGGNGFHGGQGGNVTSSSRFDGGGGAGGLGVIRGGDAGGGVGGCDYNTLGNGGNAITNVYGLHLNARNIWNNLVTSKGGDGGNGGIYYRSGTSGGFAPSGGNGGNGANGGEIMVSYDTMHEQGTFDVSGGMGGIGAKMGFSSESCWRYEQPNGTDGTAGRVVFKSSKSPYIQDLMLQNDSDNEAILISWKDPRVLSWNKTIIRYSTTDYPANLTDGTLAVEETTRNQYVLTPYSLSGVSDQTTYYFTAFALDSNNSIIDTETATITTEFGRHPGANTLVYLPLATDSNDQSGNGNNGTDTNITYSDGKAVFNSSGTSCILLDTTSLPNTFTLHMVIAITTHSGYQISFRYSDSAGYDNSRCYIRGYGTYTEGGVSYLQTNISVCNDSSTVNYGLVASDTNEHLLSYVVYEQSGNTYMKFYIDGVYQTTKSAVTNYYTGAKLSLGNRRYNKNEGLKGTMREVIMESTQRTDAEVLALAQQFGFA